MMTMPFESGVCVVRADTGCIAFPDVRADTGCFAFPDVRADTGVCPYGSTSQRLNVSTPIIVSPSACRRRHRCTCVSY